MNANRKFIAISIMTFSFFATLEANDNAKVIIKPPPPNAVTLNTEELRSQLNDKIKMFGTDHIGHSLSQSIRVELARRGDKSERKEYSKP